MNIMLLSALKCDEEKSYGERSNVFVGLCVAQTSWSQPQNTNIRFSLRYRVRNGKKNENKSQPVSFSSFFSSSFSKKRNKIGKRTERSELSDPSRAVQVTFSLLLLYMHRRMCVNKNKVREGVIEWILLPRARLRLMTLRELLLWLKSNGNLDASYSLCVHRVAVFAKTKNPTGV